MHAVAYISVHVAIRYHAEIDKQLATTEKNRGAAGSLMCLEVIE